MDVWVGSGTGSQRRGVDLVKLVEVVMEGVSKYLFSSKVVKT